MSGGSYNYLCWKDSTEVGSEREALEKMAARLKELGAYDAAYQTEEISVFFITLNQKIEKLRDVWHAVEWLDSGDWGEAQAMEVINPEMRTEE